MSNIFFSILFNQCPFSAIFVIWKLPIIKLSISSIHFSSSMGLTLKPIALVLWSIRPFLYSEAMFELVFPLTLVFDIALKLYFFYFGLSLFNLKILSYFQYLLDNAQRNLFFLFLLIFVIVCKYFSSVWLLYLAWANFAAWTLVPHLYSPLLLINYIIAYISCLVYFWMDFLQLLLKLKEILLESFIRLDNFPSIFGIFFGLSVAHSILFHEEGND